MVITSKLALKLFVVFILAKEIYDNRNKTKFTFLKIEIETMMMAKRICHYKSVCSETRDEFLPKILFFPKMFLLKHAILQLSFKCLVVF